MKRPSYASKRGQANKDPQGQPENLKMQKLNKLHKDISIWRKKHVYF
jgi:hypothetical protein